MRKHWHHKLLFVLCMALITVPSLAQDAPRAFPRYNFNVGGGYGIGRGDVGGFVGNSFEGTGGAGYNFSKLFGVSAEYMYYKLSFRPSVANTQSLGSADGSLNAVSLNGIVRSPFHVGPWGAYGIFGIGFYRRDVYSNAGPLRVGSVCQPAWVWWDIYCVNGFVPDTPAQSLGSFNKIAGGYNYGGGITYSLNRWHKAKVYAEWRYHKAYFSDVEDVVWPITVGLRW
ncbi:MAG: outer membrane beta-barrel protein [Terriglobales bacterium]